MDRDFGKRYLRGRTENLLSESSTLVPGGAADPPPRLARRCDWGLNTKHSKPKHLYLALVQALLAKS